MIFERFVRENLVKKQRPDFGQIASQLKRSKKDLKTAKSVLTADPTWAFAISYHAMLRAGRALMFSKGYLPTTSQSQKTIVEFTKDLLGPEYVNVMSRFSRMRRQRHNFIYDSQNHITVSQARTAIETAEKLVEKIIDLVRRDNPQKELFD
jgi:uncharacterized protein (UPF0332 family)